MNQNAVTQKIEQTQLKWYGHVKRMKESRVPRQILEARTEGKRPRGRQRITYMDVIEKLVRKRGKNIGEANRLVANRKEWKKFSEESPPTL